MNPLHFLVDAFVNTFGITRPTPQQRGRAAKFVAAMLVAAAVFVVAAAWLLHGMLAR